MSRMAKTSVVIFFLFMLLHQTDKLLIGPLQTDIMDTFQMTYTQWGFINSGALVVGTIFFPLWGWLSDKYSRAKLLAAASFIWGSTTWLSGLTPYFHTPPKFSHFMITRSSTGIDDSSYPGMYSMISDLYLPNVRGKIYGILQLTGPLGYLIGMVIALVFTPALGGWENVFFLTGSLGIVLAFVIFFFVKDVPRGSGEEELQGVEGISYKFNWKALSEIFKKKSLWMIYLQGFFGTFPWNVMTYYFFGYLEKERGYSSTTTLLIMAPAILMMAVGYPAGGWFGDKLFKRHKSGRLIASEIGVIIGMIGVLLALSIQNIQVIPFGILISVTCFFMPFAEPNILSAMYDVVLPEVRSSTNSIVGVISTAGSCTAPIIAGLIADSFTVGFSIKWICTVAWGMCVIFLLLAIFFMPKDIASLHKELEARAAVATVENN